LIGSRAVPLTADEHRLIKRCQAMADQVFTPKFRHLAQVYGDSQLQSE
jgi:hypothetical protein